MKKLLILTALVLSITSCGHSDIQKAQNNILSVPANTIDKDTASAIVAMSVTIGEMGFERGRDYQKALDLGEPTDGLTKDSFTNDVYIVCMEGFGLQ